MEIRDWLRQKLSDSRPRKGLGPGEAGKTVRAIAEAVAGLEGRGSIAFGVHIETNERAELTALASEFRDVIRSWRSFLGSELGDEGRDLVDGIALEYGFRVAVPENLPYDPLGSAERASTRQRAAVERLNEMLADTARLTMEWASKGRLDPDDKIRVWVGDSDGEALRTMVESYERRYGSPFPSDLAYTLSLFNGFAVGSDAEGGAAKVRPRELPEPALWPANAYGDHFVLAEAEFEGLVEFFVFGAMADSGYLALGVTRERGLSGVYWIDRGGSVVSPRLIADDFSGFLSRWLDASLCLPLLLEQSSVPGWGA